jgi:hypothetical protein
VIFASLYLGKEENNFFAVFFLSLSLLFIKEKKDKKTQPFAFPCLFINPSTPEQEPVLN